ncbi:cell adhesion molecule CEACAM6-like [Hemitrygon akajei]|uniref:cell adhesion molecule CEACAM6-like n=1 Tax=Hemitrygon akajei TaxID=2704970 RepID=UPI003BFA263B
MTKEEAQLHIVVTDAGGNTVTAVLPLAKLKEQRHRKQAAQCHHKGAVSECGDEIYDPQTRKCGSVSECNRDRRCSLGMSGLPFAALVLCLHITAGESQQFTIIVEHSQINVTTGADALFSVRPSSSVRSGSWCFKGKTVAQWIDQTGTVDNEYRSRAELFPHNGSLLLKSVNMSDSGEYRVNMVPTNGSQTSATVTLRVTEPVSNVTVTSNATRLIEYSDTVRLTCSATGTDVSYLWLEENSRVIPGGRIDLNEDNSTLTVSGVLRTDARFTCRASNMINEITSSPFSLHVNYRPDRPYIITQPDSSFHVAGSTIRLTCFTESRPDAKLNWQLNGAHLQSGQEVILDNISVSHTGKYTCEAFNMVTKRNNASTTQINVFGPVTGVAVVANDSTPLENLDTIALSCDASGTVQTQTWFKDNQPIRENGRIFTSTDKGKLAIISVTRNDAGTYKCIASNSFSVGAGETYVQVYSPKTDDNCTLTSGAIVGIVLGLLVMSLVGGFSGWLFARKTGGLFRTKDPPKFKYGTSRNPGRKSTFDTNTVNSSEYYENVQMDEQGARNNAQDENSTYMLTSLVNGNRWLERDLAQRKDNHRG